MKKCSKIIVLENTGLQKMSYFATLKLHITKFSEYFSSLN